MELHEVISNAIAQTEAGIHEVKLDFLVSYTDEKIVIIPDATKIIGRPLKRITLYVERIE